MWEMFRYPHVNSEGVCCMFSKFIVAAAAAVLSPVAASAATYDFADFGNSVFSYGYGSGTSFTAFPNSYTGGCYGVATFACASNGSNSSEPFIGAASDGSAFQFAGTVGVPANTLVFHPGPAATGQDAILIFTAPTSSTYVITGDFLRLSQTSPAGDGTLISAYVNGVFNSSIALPNAPYLASAPLGGSLFLNAGDTIQLNVGNNGDYTYDSTGLQGSIASVPEPTTWAMMIGGFGVVGGAMRRRAKVRVAFA